MPESFGIPVLCQVRSVLDHEDDAHAHEDQEHAEDQEEVEVVHLLDDLSEEQSAHDGTCHGKYRHDGAHLSAVALFRDIGGPRDESGVVSHGSDEAHEAVPEDHRYCQHQHLAVVEILSQPEEHHRDAPQCVSDQHLWPSSGEPVAQRPPDEASERAGHRRQRHHPGDDVGIRSDLGIDIVGIPCVLDAPDELSGQSYHDHEEPFLGCKHTQTLFVAVDLKRVFVFVCHC